MDVWYAQPAPGWKASGSPPRSGEEGRVVEPWGHRPGVDARLAHRPAQRGVVEADAEPARHREQVVDRDGPGERLGVVERAPAVAQHADAVELRTQPADRVVGCEDALRRRGCAASRAATGLESEASR